MFEYFLNNIKSEEMKYFNEKVNLKKSKKNIEISKDKIIKCQKQYYISPDFLGINHNDKNLKEIKKEIQEKYPEDKTDNRILNLYFQ